MATTARIAATTGAGTYTATIAAGSVGNFAASGLGPNESIKLLGSNGAGTVYSQIVYIDEGGSSRNAMINRNNSSIQITGPLDFRFEKTSTSSAVELSEYT